jgi:hypothetical protein
MEKCQTAAWGRCGENEGKKGERKMGGGRRRVKEE